MNAVIKLPDGTLATYDGKLWACDRPMMQEWLNASFSLPALRAEDYFIYYPNPVASVAKWAAENLNAKVVSVPETDSTEGKVY